ncbi:MAG: N-acetyltransferase [Herpetosiphonaceae bacterium]|nr:MAG: N-acetyltransferase [Herpetosiphonaceae bacterium]
MAQSKSPIPRKDAVITLREVTKQTVRTVCNLKVAPQQEQFVAPNAVSIAEAYFEPDAAWFRAIYADETPIGFLMLHDNPVSQEYYLWRFMIDAQFQGYGFGRQALELLIAHVRNRPGAKALYTSCVPGDGSPCPFYEKMGFVYTGDVDDGELVMRLDL